MNEAMSPCARGCGAHVPDADTLCGACQVGAAVREAEKRASNLVTTERRCGPTVIRTRGYAVYLDVPPKNDDIGRMYARDEARALLDRLREAVEHVEALKSPYVMGDR